MGKHKKKSKSKPYSPDYEDEGEEYYTGGIPIRGCPFCGSDNIVVAMPLGGGEATPNMTLICLGCKTKFILDMMCNENYIKDAFRFWNSRD